LARPDAVRLEAIVPTDTKRFLPLGHRELIHRAQHDSRTPIASDDLKRGPAHLFQIRGQLRGQLLFTIGRIRGDHNGHPRSAILSEDNFLR